LARKTGAFGANILALTGDAALVVDERRRIVFANAALEVLLGHDVRKIIGKACFAVFRSLDAHGCEVCGRDCLAVRMAREGEVIPTRELLLKNGNGSRIAVSATTIVFPAEWHRRAMLAHLFREISETHVAAGEDTRPDDPAAAIAEVTTGRATEPRAARPPSLDGAEAPMLTPRESQVLALLEHGQSTAAIADALYVSKLTVRNHVRAILQKLGVHSRLEAVARVHGSPSA